MISRRIDVRPGRTLSILIEGEAHADKTVFLFHGLGGRAKQWREQIPWLSKTYRVIAPDFLGQGDSPAPNESSAYGFDELLKDALAVFDQFKGANNAVIGHSYGGAFATQVCLQRLNEIKCLILLAPMPATANYPIPFIYRLPVFLMEWLRPLLIREFDRRAFSNQASHAMRKEEIAAIENNPFWIAKALILGIKKIPPTDVKNLPLPSLLVIPTEDGLVLPTMQRAFYQSLPNKRVMELAGGHIVMLEQPQVVNTLLREFLKTHFDTEGMSTTGSTSAL